MTPVSYLALGIILGIVMALVVRWIHLVRPTRIRIIGVSEEMPPLSKEETLAAMESALEWKEEA